MYKFNEKIIPNNQKIESKYTIYNGTKMVCTACGNALHDEQIYISKNYCPNCGAKIKKIEEVDY